MWEENLAGMTISELKELLKRHDLVRSGTRQQMISRLSISLWRGELLKYESLEKMTVPELKELLKADGKSFAGKKKELIDELIGKEQTLSEKLQKMNNLYYRSALDRFSLIRGDADSFQQITADALPGADAAFFEFALHPQHVH